MNEDILFLDTSVFIAENFLEGKRIQEIFKLCYAGHIKLILSIITYNEILNRIKINGNESLIGYKTFRDKVKILRNVPQFEERFKKIDGDAIIIELQNLFIERIESLKPIMVGYPEMNIQEIFDKYFKNEKPFNSTDKKNEFPDAFVLWMLEKWCTDNNKRCYVIAGDKDINKYQCPKFIVIEQLSDYLDEKLRKIEKQEKRNIRIQIASKLYDHNKESLKKKVEDWLVEQLHNTRNYKNFTHYDIEDVSIDQSDVELGDIQVASTSDSSIIFTTNAQLSILVELELSPGGSWFDEDENYHFPNAGSEIEMQKIIPVSFEVDIPLAGDEYMDIDILEINNNRDIDLF